MAIAGRADRTTVVAWVVETEISGGSLFVEDVVPEFDVVSAGGDDLETSIGKGLAVLLVDALVNAPHVVELDDLLVGEAKVVDGHDVGELVKVALELFRGGDGVAGRVFQCHNDGGSAVLSAILLGLLFFFLGQ